MILNLLILGFILLMLYWWGPVQGAFSGFLHLVVVIVAGTLALALWEPIVLGFLAARMPAYAWGVGLLGPFILLLLGLRLTLDKLVPGNVQFSAWFNALVGGLFGALAAVLTAGITIIGVGFLPLPARILGYQPLSIGEQGQVLGSAGQGLWIPVDTQAAGFFTMLSRGSMFPMGGRTPLASHRPALAEQAALFRMRYQPLHSLAILPGSVRVAGVYSLPLPVKELPEPVAKGLGELTKSGEHKLVVVDTAFTMTAGTYDPDSRLRLAPPHVRLIVESRRGAKLRAPVALSTPQPVTNLRLFEPIDDANLLAETSLQSQTFGWTFILGSDDKPRFLLVRNLRLDLGESDPVEERGKVLAAIGDVSTLATPTSVEGDVPPTQGEAPVGPRQGTVAGALAESIAVDASLPKVISRNYATDFRFEGDAIVEGDSDVRPFTENPAQSLLVRRVYAYPHQQIVRLTLRRELAQSIFGKAVASAAMLQGIYLEDNLGQRWFPMGYAHLEPSGLQRIRFGVTPIQRAAELPIARLNDADVLHLYFPVPRSSAQQPLRIVRIHLAQTKQDVQLDVPE